MEEFQKINRKKNSTGLVVLVVFLFIVILGLVGYICYDKGVFDSLLGKDKPVEEPKTEEKLSVLEVEKLVKTVPYSEFDGAELKDSYSGSLITIDNIDHRLLLEYAYNKLEGSNKNFDGSPEMLAKILKEVYNIDNVKHQTFALWTYDNGKYVPMPSGGPYESILLSKLVNYDVKNNQLIVTEKAGFILHGADLGYANSGLPISIDRSYSKDKVVKVIKYNEKAESYDVAAQDYFDNNLDKFNTYNHTFKKASDGKYYWYSSEIVNE